MATQRLVARNPKAVRSGGMYRPELDALRFFAFLAVFFSHSLAGYPAHTGVLALLHDAGNFGVPIFFTLSAYLITELLLREQERTDAVCLGKFYLRRILRIWPLYFAILLSYTLLGRTHPAFSIEPGRILASLFMAGNWYILLHPAITTPMRALWSISVEEQFYLLWPVAARWGGRSGLRTLSLSLLPAAIVVIAISAPSQWYLHVTLWLNSFVQFQFLAVGALLAITLRGRMPLLGPLTRLVLATGSIALFLLAAGVFHIKRPQPVHSVVALCAGYECLAAGSAMLLLSVLGVPCQYTPRWLAYLGRISFGLYVLHETGFLIADEAVKRLRFSWAAALFPNKALALAITVLLAMLSYQFLEKPFLYLKRRFTLVPSRPV